MNHGPVEASKAMNVLNEIYTGSWLDQRYLGNSLGAWIVGAALVAGVFFALVTLRFVLQRRVAAFADKTSTRLDNVVLAILKRTRRLTIFVVALYVGSLAVVLPGQAERLFEIALTVSLAYQVAIWGSVFIDEWLSREFQAPPELAGRAGAGYGAIGFVARLILWAVILLMALDNLGINVTALVAGLGVGGIAIALAVQNILGDVFCSLSIILDKPFEIGDFIIVDDMMGTVERIGIKTTRLRSLSGEQLVFSNTDLVKGRVRNYKRMFERRIVFDFGVIYQTTPDQLELIPKIVREVVDGIEDCHLDRAHFKQFGASSLDFEVVYYVHKPDYNVYMDIQQAINLGIMRRLLAEGMEFAYPTQTLYVQHEGGGEETAAGAGHGGGGDGAEATERRA
jgi:small-conductance mechanosensitive channel